MEISFGIVLAGSGLSGITTAASSASVATVAAATAGATTTVTAAATATAATAAAVTAPAWLVPAACTAVGVVAAAAVAKAVEVCTCGETSTEEAVQKEPSAILGTGAFGQITLRKEGMQAWALKKVSHAVLSHRQLESVLDVERQALHLTQDCPFVVQFYGHVESRQETILIFEVCQDLVDVYTQAALWGKGQVKQHVAAVVEALAYIHDKSIFHRDVKPKNLLLDHTNTCKLCDFGSAKIGVGRAYSLVGTAEHMASEMINKSGHSASVDWWGLGCVVYELLTGGMLFSGKRDQVFSKIVLGVAEHEQMAIIDSTHPNAADLVRKLFAATEQERFPTLGMEVPKIEAFKSHPWFTCATFRWPDPGKVQHPSWTEDSFPSQVLRQTSQQTE